MLEKIFRDIDNSAARFVERLREAVAIPSVSADPAKREEVMRMVEWTKKLLESLGACCEFGSAGTQTLPNGQSLECPPILFAQLGNDPKKKTLMVYGHLDVQPARLQDGWNTEPFELTEKDGKLYGRGSSDDKGPVLAWINAIETLQKNGAEIPVNLKFCFEGMEESGSKGLDEALAARQNTFLADVDFTCISDSNWLGPDKPCLTYGLRGICYYCVEISGPKQDLHSGVYGGACYEPMGDICYILSELSTVDGQILIPGIAELVAPRTEDEDKIYESIDFDMEAHCKSIGATKLTKSTKKEVLMNKWRYPSISIHGVEGCFSGPGSKTVIPAKVTGKFSLRIVPNMMPEQVHKLVKDYINHLWSKRGSPNRLRIDIASSGKPWVADYKDSNYQAGTRALQKVFKVDPDYTREGCSIPVTITFQELTGKSVLHMPICACDDMAHSQNEKMNIRNYIEGTKALAAYLLELKHA